MADTLFPVDAVAGSPSYGGRMLRQVNAVAFGGATPARPLGGRSGVRPGTSVTTVTATSTTWSCGPLSGVADVQTAAEAGLVTFALDAVATGAVTAASASFARRDLIYVQIDIPVEDGSAVPVVTRKYIAGTVASTDPALPVSRAFAIARINVPISGGGSPTVTWIAPYAVAAGGILPVATLAQLNLIPGWLEARAAVFADSTAANNGSYRWNGTQWLGNAPLSATGGASIGTTEVVVPSCSLTLAPGNWDVIASAYMDWSTSGGSTPIHILRLRSGGVAGTEVDQKRVNINGHVGQIPVSLQAQIVLTVSTVVVLTGVSTGPAAGTTLVQNARIRAIPSV